jgi:hypothetical protein
MRHATKFLLLGAIAALHAAAAWAANGDILERSAIATAADAAFVAERVVYESDGLRIVGFLAYPKGAADGAARLPCVLWNRGGNRDANNALWRITMVRMAHDPATRAYVERRTTEGRSKREIIRVLKRYIARQLFPHIQHLASPS